MKNVLIITLIIIISNISCVEGSKNYNCSDLEELNSIFNKRFIKLNESIKMIKFIYPKNSFERKVGDSLIQLENKFTQLLSGINKNEPESNTIKIEKLIKKIKNLPYRKTKEPNYISKIRIESIEELNNLIINFKHQKCQEFNELKLYSIVENLFLEYCNNSFTPSFHFNEAEAYVFSESNKITEDDSLSIDIAFKAEDTASTKMIRYWIDDSTMNESNQTIHKSNNPIIFKGKKGLHKAEGYIMVKRRGVQTWKKWEYEYVID